MTGPTASGRAGKVGLSGAATLAVKPPLDCSAAALAFPFPPFPFFGTFAAGSADSAANAIVAAQTASNTQVMDGTAGNLRMFIQFEFGNASKVKRLSQDAIVATGETVRQRGPPVFRGVEPIARAMSGATRLRVPTISPSACHAFPTRDLPGMRGTEAAASPIIGKVVQLVVRCRAGR
jgi:hypothetical protein